MNIVHEKPRWALFVVLSVFLAVMSCLKYYNLHSTYFDLGVFLNNFLMFSKGLWTKIFLSHMQPYIIFWRNLYSVLPEYSVPYIVLSSQAVLLSLPVLMLNKHYGTLPTLAYVLYFPVWYNALFDFHMDHLAVPLLFGFFVCEKQNKIRTAVLMACLLAFVKEIYALQTLMCGVYLFLIRRQRLPGIFLAVFGALYFLISMYYIKPFFNAQFVGGGTIFLQNTSAYGWLGSGLQEMVLFILTQPQEIFFEIFFTKGKMVFLAYVFGALGFVSLLRPGTLLVGLPILGQMLLSRNELYYGYTHHYTAGLIPPLIIAFAGGLPKARELWKRIDLEINWFNPALVTGLFICHALLSPSPIGRKFYSEKAWNYHYSIYFPVERNKMIKTALENYVNDPDAVVTTQNTMNWGHLVHRRSIFIFPDGATRKISPLGNILPTWSEILAFAKTRTVKPLSIEKIWSDYVVLDIKRPWFIVDQGCHWIAGKCQNDTDFESDFLAQLDQTKERFETIYENDGLIILKRRL